MLDICPCALAQIYSLHIVKYCYLLPFYYPSIFSIRGAKVLTFYICIYSCFSYNFQRAFLTEEFVQHCLAKLIIQDWLINIVDQLFYHSLKEIISYHFLLLLTFPVVQTSRFHSFLFETEKRIVRFSLSKL